MTQIWDAAWDQLNVAFAEIVGEVRAANPRATSRRGRTATEWLPFAAFLTFSREGVAGQEDLVIAVDCLRRPDRLLLSCAISTGEGHLLIDGPEQEIQGEVDQDPAALNRWLSEVRVFLGRNAPVAAKYMRIPARGSAVRGSGSQRTGGGSVAIAPG